LLCLGGRGPRSLRLTSLAPEVIAEFFGNTFQPVIEIDQLGRKSLDHLIEQL